jgi:hypothetical protein
LATVWNTNKTKLLDVKTQIGQEIKSKILEYRMAEHYLCNNNSYLKKIIDSNFDGVYLDIIDALNTMNNKLPLAARVLRTVMNNKNLMSTNKAVLSQLEKRLFV